MRGKYGPYFEDDEREISERPLRRHSTTATATRERDARDAWEPTVCPTCGTDHSDVLRVRLRRAGSEFEARCLDCNAIAARFVDGVWSS